MNWIKWKKQDGTELQSNDAESTVAYCESLGWKRIGGNAPKDEPWDLTRGPEPQIAKDKGKSKSKGSRSPEAAE